MTTTISLNAAEFRTRHGAGHDYEGYLATDADRAVAWRTIEGQVALNEPQKTLLSGFTRDMKVLVISGIWCGDCAQQGPLLHRIAEGSPNIHMTWLDRDDHAPFAEHFKINEGARVPVALFMAEDFELVSVYGDRTLSRYRAMAANQLGGACPLPGAPVPDDELHATMQDWLDEFERVQLLLRLSGRLRQLHGD